MKIDFNKKFKCFGTIVICIMLTTTAFSQTTTLSNDIQNKYWYYRYKLLNDFMIVGDSQGFSQPAAVRNRNSTALRWSESTLFLGWYLGVLGTENTLLRVSGDVEGRKLNETELYYALLAIHRLDSVAETHQHIPGVKNPIVNGFFARDDVPANFVMDHYSHFHSSYTYEQNVTGTDSDWKQNNRNYEMSRDHYIHVLMGLKLVWLYAAKQQTTIRINDGSYVQKNLSEMAKTIALRIINYVLVHNNTQMLSKVKHPTTGQDLNRGPEMEDLVWPLSQLRREMLNTHVWSLPVYKAFGKYWQNPGAPADFNTWWTVYNLVSSDPNIPLIGRSMSKNDNRHMSVTMACIAPNSMVREKVGKAADWEGWEPFYDLLFDASRYGGKGWHGEALTHLSTAPCQGISHQMGVYSGGNWHATHRYIKKKWDQKNGQASGGLSGYFNGLDYMLLHNLYYLQTTNTLPRFQNKYDRKETGTLTGTLKQGGFHYIRSDADIASNADVENRAGVEVHLLPGFETHHNAKYLAYIAPYSCSGGAQYNKTQSSSGLYNMTPEEGFQPEFYQKELVYGSEEDEEKVDGAKPNKFQVFPNPTKDRVKVEFSSCNDCSYKVQLLDMSGRVISQFQSLHGSQVAFDLSELEQGVYLIQVTSVDGNETNVVRVTKI